MTSGGKSSVMPILKDVIKNEIKIDEKQRQNVQIFVEKVNKKLCSCLLFFSHYMCSI